MIKVENIINHIVLVLDASASMGTVSREVVKVADNQIKYLASRSQELDQETRVTVYTFNTSGLGGRLTAASNIQCLIYDKDVLRMPSIAGLYKTAGMTPLVDASLLALNDLALTPEKYGDHSFLVYVLTDGAENASRNKPNQLLGHITGLPEHWTVAAFVPNQAAVQHASKYGFPANNIAIWDATTAVGVQEAGEKIRQTTETFMTNRAKGIRGSKDLFSLASPSLAKVATKLTPLQGYQYALYDVNQKIRIDDFVFTVTKRPYQLGKAYYQLSKPENIQPQKQIVIRGRDGVYAGYEARQLLGLPDFHVRVAADDHPEYEIFVQSTSYNRNLVPNTKLLLLR